MHLDASDLLVKIDKLQDYSNILVPALGATRKKMRKVLSENIRSIYAISKPEANSRMRTKITTAPPEITITVKRKRYTLVRFLAGEIGGHPAVTVKEGGVESVKGPSFIAPVSGNTQIVKRTGKAKTVPKKGSYAGKRYKRGPNKGNRYLREPVEVLHTVSTAQMAENEKAGEPAMKEMQQEFLLQVEKQHKKYFGK